MQIIKVLLYNIKYVLSACPGATLLGYYIVAIIIPKQR